MDLAFANADRWHRSAADSEEMQKLISTMEVLSTGERRLRLVL